MRRAARNGLVLVCLAVFTAPAGATAAEQPPGAPFSASEYWQLADRVARRMDRYWVERRGYYKPAKVRLNAPLLVTHAAAALAGHRGPARSDERARTLTRKLLSTPPWNDDGSIGVRDKMFHVPGWTTQLNRTNGSMGKVVDPAAAEGLLWAWRARKELALTQADLELIKDRVSRASRARFYRYPNARLNQWNFNAELYAYRAEVVGDGTLLRRDYRRHLSRFVREARRPRRRGQAGNLGPTYRFHYFPSKSRSDRANLDSPEYANIVLDGLNHYDEAVAAGMAPLSAAELELLQAWVRRVLGGYWTHGGYLNWDTGHGFARWHFGNFWAFADGALIAVATTPSLQPSPAYGSWAKWIFDRGLVFYLELLDRKPRGLPLSNMFGIVRRKLGGAHSRIFGARMQAHAARAAATGMGSLPGEEPPPLYAFDADIGRLAVTTPRYSTAIVPVNRGAFPYGGIELARLFDGDQQVVSGTGGQHEAAFGVTVRDERSGVALQSQTPREQVSRRSPVILAGSPRGRVTSARRHPKRPDAGPFETIKAAGSIAAAGYRVTSRYRFLADRIEGSWEAERRDGRQRWSADAQFPLWGRRGRVIAVLADGSEQLLGGPGAKPRDIRMERVAYFVLRGAEASYVVVPGKGGLRARTLRGRHRAANPSPGPTLAITFARRQRGRSATLEATILPGATEAELVRMAKRYATRR